MEAGERGEDVRVDEVELCLDLVAPEVVNGRTLLIQDQVLGVRPKPKKEQTAHAQRPEGPRPQGQPWEPSTNTDGGVQRE